MVDSVMMRAREDEPEELAGGGAPELEGAEKEDLDQEEVDAPEAWGRIRWIGPGMRRTF